MIYNEPPLVLEADRLTDALGTICLSDLPDPQPKSPARLKDTTPLIERLWRIALSDIESNIVETPRGRYLGAGTDFGAWVFVRDIAYAGVLGLNRLYPDLMRSSLEIARQLRTEVGFTVPTGYVVEEVDVDWREEDVSVRAYHHKYLIGPYTRATDDVVWLWCADDLLEEAGTPDDWRWVYETGKRCFDLFYWPFYDADDGLFHGQASFVDVHFVEYQDTGYPQDWSISDCVLIKATSTNALYAKGLDVMASASRKLGLDRESEMWASRAAGTREHMRRRLRHPDGTFAYYRDRHGRPAERREALGTALAVLLDVASDEEAVAALKDYPVTDAGVPLFHPFYAGEKCYHNHSAWPFVDTFFIKALEVSDGQDRTALNAALLARTCRGGGTFHELVDLRDKTIRGSSRQLWTAAAFVDTCRRAGLVQLWT